MPHEITIIKLNHTGEEVTRYPGMLLEENGDEIVVETIFPFDVTTDAFVIEKGDRMLETCSTTLWYNIFQVHEGMNGDLRGWYCNITRPMARDGAVVRQDDLALDVWVSPDGRLFLLDMDEFLAIDIPDADREAALAGLSQLEARVRERVVPFDVIR